MSVSNSDSGVLDARFLRAIEVWCARNGMSAGAFGAAVYRDRDFVASLRDGRRPCLRTVDRALAVMGEPPAGPAFLGEVDAFLAVTGVKRSLLGQEATGNPSFVAQLHRGVSPKLATVEAVKTILSSKDRVVGVQGYAGTGKTTMLDRARQLAAKSGYRTIGVAPSASAARTLASEAGIETETLQRFLARNAGIAEGRLSRKGTREMRAAFRKTVLVVDEGSLASTVQARDLLRIATAIRIPRVVLVGDAKQLDAVDAGKPFAQLQAAA